MRPIDAPFLLTPDERFSEVASILASGAIRLHARSALSVNETGQPGPEIPHNSASSGLEFSDETVLSVQNG